MSDDERYSCSSKSHQDSICSGEHGPPAAQRARAQAILIDILQFSLTSIYIVSRYVGFMVLMMIIDDDGLQQDDRGLKNHFYFYIE